MVVNKFIYIVLWRAFGGMKQPLIESDSAPQENEP
jgi:hypothetical protein